MSDCYEWFDPFEERDKRRYSEERYQHAFSDGANVVLRDAILQKGRLRYEIVEKAYEIAGRLVAERVGPFVHHAFEARKMTSAVQEILRFTPLNKTLSDMRVGVEYRHATGGRTPARAVTRVDLPAASISYAVCLGDRGLD